MQRSTCFNGLACPAAPATAKSHRAIAGEAVLPAVAVIIPLYNRATKIEASVRSVLDQTMGDFELLVVDDGSSDGSAAVVEAIVDPRLRLLRQPFNAGGNAARNRGIRDSSAPIICFLDSDDRYLPTKLQRVREIMDERPDLATLLDSFIKAYPERPDRADVPLRNPVLNDNRAILEAMFTRAMWKATPQIAVRREAAVAAGLFDEGLKRRQDFDFIVRLAKVGPMALIDETLWVKDYGGDAISAGVAGFMPALLAFLDRHPEYHRDDVFRRGLAYDVARHAGRSLKQGRIRGLANDLASLASRIGWPATLALAGSGIGERLQRRQRLSKA